MKVSTNDGLIHISGQDAQSFLQGQLTCDVEPIDDQVWQLGAHCNPQGRIISLFHILKKDNEFYLLLPADMVSIAITALKKYAVFFKVTIEEVNHFDKLNLVKVEHAEHTENNINAGIPTIYPATSGLFLPHEINLDKLGGVNLEKGCYTGQEIIARMHYRGKLKTHLYKASIETNTLTLGQDIEVDGQPVGSVVNFYPVDDKAIALIMADDKSVQSGNLRASNAAIQILT